MANCSEDEGNSSISVVLTTTVWPMFYVVCIFAVLEMLFAVVCLLFNLIFRDKKIVKLTSPNLNYLIIAGVLFLSIAMICYSFPSESELSLQILCPIRAICISLLGHNLCFVVQLAKLWRIYYIFHNPSHAKKAVTDKHLILLVFIIMLPDSVIYAVFIVLECLFSSVGLQSNKERTDLPRADGLHLCFMFYSCGFSVFFVIRSVLTIVYKLLIHIVTFYLTFRLHKIKIPVLNDRFYVTGTVYITSILTVIIGMTALLLGSYPNVYSGLFAGCIWIDATTFLALTFIPKMVMLYKDPKGDSVLTTATYIQSSFSQQLKQFNPTTQTLS